jgi:hypothetical protein
MSAAHAGDADFDQLSAPHYKTSQQNVLWNQPDGIDLVQGSISGGRKIVDLSAASLNALDFCGRHAADAASSALRTPGSTMAEQCCATWCELSLSIELSGGIAPQRHKQPRRSHGGYVGSSHNERRGTGGEASICDSRITRSDHGSAMEPLFLGTGSSHLITEF